MKDSYQPTETALGAMVSSETVQVSNQVYISFLPEQPRTTGLIYYPGAKVQPESYAWLMRQLAQDGYACFIAKMPANMATQSPSAADAIIQDHPEIQDWILLGHSLGGLVAAQYAYDHPLTGLILIASYPQDKHDLSSRPLRVLSIYATRDGVIPMSRIESKHDLLPKHARHVVIRGGNHAQMGHYGPQAGDLKATISIEEQQVILFETIQEFLKAAT